MKIREIRGFRIIFVFLEPTKIVNKPGCVNLVQRKNNNSLRERHIWAILDASFIAEPPRL